MGFPHLTARDKAFIGAGVSRGASRRRATAASKPHGEGQGTREPGMRRGCWPQAASAPDPAHGRSGRVRSRGTGAGRRSGDRSGRRHRVFSQRRRDQHEMPPALHLGPARRRRPERRAPARRPPVRERHASPASTSPTRPSWGRVKPITFPSAGNHEYLTSGAQGYFDYFNGAGASAAGRATATRATTASTSAPGT